MTRAETNWTQDDAGQRYARRRFGSERARQRDPRLVAALLERYLEPGRGRRGTVLDVPGGTGRLEGALGGFERYVAADRSRSMLAQASGARVVADVLSLPFPSRSFDAVVCCRLLHHLTPPERRAALAELARVSRDLVIASFWDAHSYHALRRRLGLRRAAHPDTRLAAPRADLRADLEAAGLEVLGHAASFRFVSPQTFVAARITGGPITGGRIAGGATATQQAHGE